MGEYNDEEKYKQMEEDLKFKIKRTENHLKELKADARALLQQLPLDLRGKFNF